MIRNWKSIIIFDFILFIALLVSARGEVGKRMIPASFDWSQTHEVLTLSGHTDEVTHSLYTPDGSRIITLSKDNTTRIWDAESGKAMVTLKGHSEAVRCGAFIAGAKQILTYADDRSIKVWNVENGREISSTILPATTDRIFSADFSPDGSLLALGLKGRSEIYNSKTGELLYTLSPFGHPGLRVGAMDICFRHDGGRIITAAYSHEVAVWDARTGIRVLNLHEHGAGCLTAMYSPDMTRIASGSRDNNVIIWDARLGIILKKLNVGWEIRSVAFSPDGSLLLVIENAPRDKLSRASLWDVRAYKQVAIFSGFTRGIRATFSPDGTQFVIPSGNTAKVFEAHFKSNIITQEIKVERYEDSLDTVALEKDAIVSSEKLTKLVENALKGTSGKCRIQAASVLAQLDNIPEEVLQKLVESLKSKESEIRKNAAITLAEIGAPAVNAVTILINLLQNDNDPNVRTAAAFAIGCISAATKQPIAVTELIGRLKDKDVHVRYHAAHALDKMRADAKEALPALIEVVLTDESTGLRRQIAFNLGNAGEASLGALPTLIKGTSSKNERERWWACYTLWSITSSTGKAAQSAIPALKISIRDPSDFRDENGGPPRKYAIYAMGGIGPIVKEIDPQIITMLEDIMENDDDYYHRKAAAISLERILEVKGLRQKVRGYVRRTPR